MKKAQNEVEAKLKLVDCVIELLDARIPFASRNKTLFEITKNKKRLIVLTKEDLADPKATSKWIEFFSNQGNKVIFADLNKQKDINSIIKEAETLGDDKHKKEIARGMKPQPVRAMIIGIPNVGKSTLINKIAHRKAAGVQNKPGHTKAQQWIKVSNQFELLDTPGILQSNYDDKNVALLLALVGSINENILPEDTLADELLTFLKKEYPELLKNRFALEQVDVENHLILSQIAKNRGLLLKGDLDIIRASKLLLNEFKNGKIGRITLELTTKCL